MKKLLLIIIVSIVAITTVEAKYTQTCKVKYETQTGWSKYYTLDVDFMTGSELNSATHTFNYSSYSTYALIWWGKGEVSIIKLSSVLMCGTEATQSCITGSYQSILKGQDQDETSWQICIGNYCF